VEVAVRAYLVLQRVRGQLIDHSIEFSNQLSCLPTSALPSYYPLPVAPVPRNFFVHGTILVESVLWEADDVYLQRALSQFHTQLKATAQSLLYSLGL
jgi:hypothetical protein